MFAHLLFNNLGQSFVSQRWCFFEGTSTELHLFNNPWIPLKTVQGMSLQSNRSRANKKQGKDLAPEDYKQILRENATLKINCSGKVCERIFIKKLIVR